MNKKVLLITVIVLLVVLGVAAVLYPKLSAGMQTQQLATMPAETTAATEPLPEEMTETTEPVETTAATEATEPEPVLAPDFTVLDWDGNEVKLSEHMGKPMVLNFWASWCGPCQMEMPHFEQAYLDMGEEITFFMVNMTSGRETQKSAQEFLDSTGYTFPVYFDLDMDAAYAYGVYSLPMTVFVDEQGNVQDLAIGAIDEATLLSKIDTIR